MRPSFVGTLVLAATVLLAGLGGTEGRPAVDESPIKFSLDTGGEKDGLVTEKTADSGVASRIQNGMEWLSRMADTLRFGRGRLVNSVAIAKNIIAERVEQLRSETRNNVAGAIGAANDIIERSRSSLQSDQSPFASLLPAKSAGEVVKLENEKDQAFLERRKTTNPISMFLENVLKPKPIVDNIKEEEKYGNNGDRFIGVGRALVTGFEGLGNLLNAVVEFPLKAAKNASRNLNDTLNQIGARLVGLQ